MKRERAGNHLRIGSSVVLTAEAAAEPEYAARNVGKVVRRTRRRDEHGNLLFIVRWPKEGEWEVPANELQRYPH